MKRISFRLGIAFLAFGVGVGAAWGYLRILQPPLSAMKPTPVEESASSPIPPSSSESPSETVKITLARSYRDEHRIINAEFEVVNGSGEPVYYQGYSKGDNEFWSVRRGSRSRRFAPFCGTGMAERTLSAGESARFKVVVGREGGSLQVGFDFFIGESRARQTIWSGDVHIPEG